MEQQEHHKDKVMKSALILLIIVVFGFLGVLIFAGKNTDSERLVKEVRVVENAEEANSKLSKAIVSIDGKHLIASIADTDISRKNGLSNIHSIGPNEGKLFVFGEEGYHEIWAKDMKFNFDIMWINDVGTVVHIVENVSPDSYPTSYAPAYPASMVVETNAGWVDEHNVKVGDQVITADLIP